MPSEGLEALGPRTGARSVQAWCDSYLPFEPKTFLARELRDTLRRELRRLVATRGEVLHAVFAGTVPARADVENLLLYNVDIDGGCFASAGDGLRFELATRPLRPPPSGRERAYGYQYRPVPKSNGLRHWRDVRTVARWDALSLGRAPALADIWLTLHHAARSGQLELAPVAVTPSARFAVRLAVTAPPGLPVRTASLVKPSVDGVVCALQAHGDESTVDDVARRLAERLDDNTTSADYLAGLLRGHETAVLGVVHRLLLPRGDGVQWAPGDDLCVAGELLRSETPAPDGRSRARSSRLPLAEITPVDGAKR